MVSVDDNLPRVDKITDIKANLSLQKKGHLTVTVLYSTTAGSPLNGIDVYLFSSKEQAEFVNDVGGVPKNTFARTATTTGKGQAQFQNLDDNTYYIGLIGRLPGQSNNVTSVHQTGVVIADNDDKTLIVPLH